MAISILIKSCLVVHVLGQGAPLGYMPQLRRGLLPHLAILKFMAHNIINVTFQFNFVVWIQARQTRPNSGGVAEGNPRFDKGGVAIIFFTFYALKIELFRVFTQSG